MNTEQTSKNIFMFMIDGRNVFDQPINSLNKTYKMLEKFLQGKEMTTQLVVG